MRKGGEHQNPTFQKSFCCPKKCKRNIHNCLHPSKINPVGCYILLLVFPQVQIVGKSFAYCCVRVPCQPKILWYATEVYLEELAIFV